MVCCATHCNEDGRDVSAIDRRLLPQRWSSSRWRSRCTKVGMLDRALCRRATCCRAVKPASQVGASTNLLLCARYLMMMAMPHLDYKELSHTQRDQGV